MGPQGQIKTEMIEEMSTHLTTWFPVNGCNQFESLQDKNVRGLRKKSISGSTGAIQIISIAFWLLDSAKCEGGASFFHQQKWHPTISSWLLVAGSTHFIEDCTISVLSKLDHVGPISIDLTENTDRYFDLVLGFEKNAKNQFSTLIGLQF